MGSVNVRTGGVWKPTNKVYAWHAGKWKRAYGVYYWGTQGGVTKWWPVFDFGATLPAPTGFAGSTATHSSGTMVWNAVDHPAVVGYKIAHSGVAWSGFIDKTTTSYNWTGLGVDSSNTFNIYSVDEFGNLGPASNAITLRTGHPTNVRTNPSWPGADLVNIWPYATATYYDDLGRWNMTGGVSSYPVEQGIGPGKYGTKCRGCVSYANAWGHFMNACASWGVSPPQDPGIVAVDDADMMQIYRYKYVTAGGTTKCWVAPGSINFADVKVRHPGLVGNHGETWFASPTPNAWRYGPFDFANGNALVTWMRTWMGLYDNTGYRYNGMIILDNVDHGGIDQDGINYVNLAGGLGNGDPGCPWVVRIAVRFSYVHTNYLAPAWG